MGFTGPFWGAFVGVLVVCYSAMTRLQLVFDASSAYAVVFMKEPLGRIFELRIISAALQGFGVEGFMGYTWIPARRLAGPPAQSS